MVGSLILETVLFVIRTTVPPKLHYAVEMKSKQRRRGTAANPSGREGSPGQGWLDKPPEQKPPASKKED